MATKVDLDEIKNIPEDVFKKNLFEWVEQMDISKELQSKLRSDLFQNFGKTALGRQIAAQYQQSQRMVLSPMVLVINTLVAEFLYAQNCHFSLSVFSSEVPYKNVLPDFEKVSKFRFDPMELDEIMKALALDQSDAIKAEIIQTYKTPQDRDSTIVNASLLFSIIKTLCQADSTKRSVQNDSKRVQQPQDDETSCKSNRKKSKNDELHSKYYKHFNKYLELLSQHVVEISENTKKLKEPTIKCDEQQSKSSSKACQLNKRLDKITESLTNLSKSNRKARKVTEIIKSITRLTREVERCSRNVTKYSNAIDQSIKTAADANKTPPNYTEWLNQITESTYGQRFIKNLEVAQEKAIATEVQRLNEMYNEKYQTTKKLIRFHYKQKTFEKFRNTVLGSQGRMEDFNGLIDEKLRVLKEQENYWKQNLARASTQMTADNMSRITSIPVTVINQPPVESTNQSVLQTVQPSVKSKKSINVEVPNEPVRPIEPVIDNMVQVAKNRLQELETETEQLDETLQHYLKQHNEQKQILADDTDRVWKQYEVAKDNMVKTFVVPERRSMGRTFYFETIRPAPVTTSEPILPPILSEINPSANPYKILHANLTATGSIRKKEIKGQGNVPLVTLQKTECNRSADKVIQIPTPMKIKSIMKKPIESETKTLLRISTNHDHPLSDASDASSYMTLKNVSSSDILRLVDSKPSDASANSKLNSPVSNRSEIRKSNIEVNGRNTLEPINAAEEIGAVGITVQPNNLNIQHGFEAVRANSSGVDAKEISSLFQKIEISNRLTQSPVSSESSVERKISTGHKSTSSDDFWK